MRQQLQQFYHKFSSLIWLVFLFAIVIGSSSCDPCRRLRKSKNIADKDSAAYCYINRKQYESASLILEELKGVYRGTPELEKTMYYYAMCKYYMGQALLASFYFTEYIQTYPIGKYTEEATFMIGKSYYALSSSYELDQKETIKAVDYFQLYLQQYPLGTKADEVTKIIQELRAKLALKAFKQADLYFKVHRYRSAIIAYKNMLSDYPDSPYREEVSYKLFKSYVIFAQRSIPEKQEERYQEAIEYYYKFVDRFPNSKHIPEAEEVFAQVQAALKKIQTKAKS